MKPCCLEEHGSPTFQLTEAGDHSWRAALFSYGRYDSDLPHHVDESLDTATVDHQLQSTDPVQGLPIPLRVPGQFSTGVPNPNGGDRGHPIQPDSHANLIGYDFLGSRSTSNSRQGEENLDRIQ